jgi:hypothetical protein
MCPSVSRIACPFQNNSEMSRRFLKRFCILQSLLLGVEDEGNVASEQLLKREQSQIVKNDTRKKSFLSPRQALLGN